MAAAQQFLQRIGEKLKAMNPFADTAAKPQAPEPEKERLIAAELQHVCTDKESKAVDNVCMRQVAECGQLLRNSTVQREGNDSYLDVSQAVVEQAKSCIAEKLNRR